MSQLSQLRSPAAVQAAIDEFVQLGRTKFLARYGFGNGRSKSSVELKHQNISAVLDALGLPYINGYKPRGNSQLLLRKSVQAYVLKHPQRVAPAGASAVRPCSAPRRSLRDAAVARSCARHRPRSFRSRRAGHGHRAPHPGAGEQAAGQDRPCGRHVRSRSTGRSAIPCRSARPRRPRGAGR